MLLDLVHLRLVEPALSIGRQAVGRRVDRLDIRHRRDSLRPQAESTFDHMPPTMALSVGHAFSSRLRERMLDRRQTFQEM